MHGFPDNIVPPENLAEHCTLYLPSACIRIGTIYTFKTNLGKLQPVTFIAVANVPVPGSGF